EQVPPAESVDVAGGPVARLPQRVLRERRLAAHRLVLRQDVRHHDLQGVDARAAETSEPLTRVGVAVQGAGVVVPLAAEAQLHAGLTQHSGTEGARVGGTTSDTAGHEHAVRKAADQLHGVGTDRRTQVVSLPSSLVQLALVVATVPDVSDTAR